MEQDTADTDHPNITKGQVNITSALEVLSPEKALSRMQQTHKSSSANVKIKARDAMEG